MALLPGRHLQLLAGQHGSCVQRAGLDGPLPPPRRYICTEYRPGSSSGRGAGPAAGARSLGAAAAAVTCLHVCPGLHDLFLAGTSDGSISLHRLQQAHALQELPAALPAAAVAVRWLTNEPAGRFLALDANGCLHLFDLASGSPGQSVALAQLAEPGSGSRCCALEVAHAAAQQADSRVAGAEGQHCWLTATYLLGFASGEVQCHNVGAARRSSPGP
jgi:hypothetical protein